MSSSSELTTSIHMQPLAGSVVSSSPLLIEGHQSSLVAFAVGSTIHLYSVKSGTLVGIYDGHKDTVISLKQDSGLTSRMQTQNGIPHTSSVIVSLSKDGVVHIWDIASTKTLHTFQFGTSILDIHVLDAYGGEKWEGCHLLAVKQTAYKTYSVHRFDMVKEVLEDDRLTVVSSPQAVCTLSFSLKGSHSSTSTNSVENTALVLLSAHSRKIFATTVGLRQVNSICLADLEDEVTVLCSHSSGLLAAGLKRGKIFLFRDLAYDLSPPLYQGRSNGSISPVRACLHWHAHPVVALTFSPRGDYLYSAADEAVLVLWPAQRTRTTAQPSAFLPRLGAPIASLAVVGSRGGNSANAEETRGQVLVVTKDNSLRLVNAANLEVTWAWTGLEIPLRRADATRNCFSLLPISSKSIILSSGNGGRLQFFDALSGTVVDGAKVVSGVRVLGGSSAIVTKMAATTSSLGITYFVTVDEQSGEDLQSRPSLKLWEGVVASKTPLTLVSQIPGPHSDASVTALALGLDTAKRSGEEKDSVAVATGSEDGFIKIWQRTVVSPQSSTNAPSVVSWRCSYSLRYRENAVSALCFSADLSLLAAAYQNLITLWDPVSATLVATLNNWPSQLPIKQCHFLEPRRGARGCGQVYLVLVTEAEVLLFDVLTLKLLWTFSGGAVKHVCVANDESAILSVPSKVKSSTTGGIAEEGWISVIYRSESETDKTENLAVFSPSSEVPLYSQRLDNLPEVLSASLIPQTKGLLLACAEGVIYRTLSDDKKHLQQYPTPAARVKSSVVASVQLVSGKSKGKEEDERPVAPVIAPVSHQVRGVASALLAENTADLARPSELAQSFLQSLLAGRNSSVSTSNTKTLSVSQPSVTKDSTESESVSISNLPSGADHRQRSVDSETVARIFESRLPRLFSSVNSVQEESAGSKRNKVVEEEQEQEVQQETKTPARSSKRIKKA